jgi:hypothetical protein
MNENAFCTHSCPKCCATLPNWDGEGDEFNRHELMVEVAKLVEMSRYAEMTGHTTALGTCDVLTGDGYRQVLSDNFIVSEDDIEKITGGFKRYFAPEPYTSYWWGDPSHNSDENHEARMLAILMFAHMLREDDVEVF